jgi:hypothetical protein
MRKNITAIIAWLRRKLIALADWLWYKIQENLDVKRIADAMEKMGVGCFLLGFFQGYDTAAYCAFPFIIASVIISRRLK